MRQRVGGHPKAQVHLLQVLLVAQREARVRNRRGVRLPRRARRQRPVIFPHQVHQMPMFQITRRRHNHVVGHVVAPEVLPQRLLFQPLDAFLGPQDGFAQRVVLPEILGEYLVDQVIGVVLVHLQLFQHHPSFPGNVAIFEQRVQDQVGKHFQGDGKVLIKNLGIEADALLGRERIQVAANGIHRAGDLFGGPVFGPLEQHVLDEMGDPVVLQGFAARAGFHPDAYRNRAHMGHRLRDDGKPVGKDLAADVSRLLLAHGANRQS